jgi:hypothetical protein
MLASAALAQTAALQGTVVDSATKKPIAGAFVSATSVATPLAPSTSRSTVQSAADGSFSFSQLQAGSYQLCVQPSTEGHLDPCVWSPPPPVVTLVAGRSISGYVLGVAPGSIVKIHIADPQGLLWQKNAAGWLPDLEMGVRTPQADLRTPHLTGVSSAGSDYEITVPLGTNLSFSIKSFHLQLANSSGAAVANSFDQQSFSQSSSAASPISFAYTVTGLIP